MPRDKAVGGSKGGGGNKGPLGAEYVTSVTSRQELVLRLKAIWKDLSGISQDDRPPGLEDTAKALVSSRIIDNPDKEVRQYTACCLANILRIYAPDAPYVSNMLLQAFSLMTAQLRGLSTITGKQAQAQGNDNPVVFLLHNLATVKSCNVMSELVQQGIPRAEEELIDLFDCLIKSVREDHTNDIREHVLEVLSACLNELEVIPKALLDTILLWMLPVHKAENPASHQLAQQFVSRCFQALNLPITNLINQILTGKGGCGSDLEDHIYALIYELHKVNPGVMLYIFPNVSVRLSAEDDEDRKMAVSLLGRLFAAPHADYGVEYPRIFREFLGRFLDKEPKIRLQMIGIGAAIMQRKPKLAEQIAPLLAARISDPEWELRSKGVKEVLQLALKSLELVSVDLVKEVGDRLADKRAEIRLDAARGLATLYASYVSRMWSDERASEELPRDLEEKLVWVPGRIMMAYSVQDLRVTILQALDEVILPKSAKAHTRTAGLMFIWDRLGPEERKGLQVILADRARTQHLILSYVEARAAWRAALDDEACEVALEEASQRLLDCIPPPKQDKKSLKGLLAKLNETKDQQVPRLLKTMSDPRQSMEGMIKARDELVAKMGTKTPLGEYVRVLSRRASSLFANQDTLSGLIDTAKALLEDGEDEDTVNPSVELIEILLDMFPTLLQGVVHELQDLCGFASREDAIQIRVLRIMASCRAKRGALLTSIMAKPGSPQQEALRKFRQDATRLCAKEGSAKASRLAASALCNFLSDPQDSSYARLLKDLTSTRALALDNPRLEAVLRVLAVLAERVPTVFEPHADHVCGFVLHKVLRPKRRGDDPTGLPELTRSGKQGSNKAHHRYRDIMTPEGRRAVAAIKLLVAHALGLKIKGGSRADDSGFLMLVHEEQKDTVAPELVEVTREELEAVAGETLDLMQDILEDDGQTPNGAKLNKHDKARLRLVCAAGTLKLMRNAYVQHRLLPIKRWQMLAWVMLDSDPRVSAAFTKKLSMAVRTAKVHLKMLAILALAAVAQPEETKSQAKAAVQRMVQTLRHGFEEYMASLEEEPAEEDKRRVTTSMMPEYVLPYLLHLLAYFPDFPTGQDDAQRWKPIMRCFSFMLDPLMQTLGTEADNLSFLLLMTNTILGGYQDAAAPNSKSAADRLRQMTISCRDYLKSKIKTQDNLQSYPGKIYLPVQLYERGEAEMVDVEQDEAEEQHRARVARRRSRDVKVEAPDGTVLEAPDWGSPISAAKATPRASVSSRKRPSTIKGSRGEKSGRKSGELLLGGRTSSTSKKRTRAVPSATRGKQVKRHDEFEFEQDDKMKGRGVDDDDEDVDNEGPSEKSVKLSAADQRAARLQRAQQRMSRQAEGFQSSVGKPAQPSSRARGGAKGAVKRKAEPSEAGSDDEDGTASPAKRRRQSGTQVQGCGNDVVSPSLSANSFATCAESIVIAATQRCTQTEEGVHAKTKKQAKRREEERDEGSDDDGELQVEEAEGEEKPQTGPVSHSGSTESDKEKDEDDRTHTEIDDGDPNEEEDEDTLMLSRRRQAVRLVG